MTTSLDTKMQLDPQFRQQWLDALRSPEWQGRETYVRLTDGAGNYCALGLAAHVNGKDPSEEGNDEVYVWLEDEKCVHIGEVYRVFDDGSMTFAQFADWLEANSEPVTP